MIHTNNNNYDLQKEKQQLCGFYIGDIIKIYDGRKIIDFGFIVEFSDKYYYPLNISITTFDYNSMELISFFSLKDSKIKQTSLWHLDTLEKHDYEKDSSFHKGFKKYV